MTNSTELRPDSARPEGLVGTHQDDLDTPVLLVDLGIFESNVSHLAEYCRSHQTQWRPHSKAHKCPDIARLQLEAGACGITCAKLSEAELMVEHEIGDILLANQVIPPRKLRRLAELQRRARVIAIVDCEAAALSLASAAGAAATTVPVLVDVDIGLHRTGVEPGAAVLNLARLIDASAGLELLGVMGYEGHVLLVEPRAAKVESCHQSLQQLVEARDALRHDGLCADVVSAGGTGCYDITAAFEGITELQAGGGIFMDLMYRDRMHVDERLGLALTVLSTVTSRGPGRVILDAGFKTMSAFHQPPAALGRDDIELDFLSAEHGQYRVCDGEAGPDLGERIHLAVGYSDSTNFLHDRFLGIRNGVVECVWNIAARGLLT